jgi:hypothetical protein
MNVSEWLLVVITIAVCATSAAVVRFALSLGPVLDSLRRTSDRLGHLTVPVESVLRQVQREVEELQVVTRRADEILGNVEGTARASQRVATEVLGVVDLIGVTRRTRAATSGAKAALTLLKHAVARR